MFLYDIVLTFVELTLVYNLLNYKFLNPYFIICNPLFVFLKFIFYLLLYILDKIVM